MILAAAANPKKRTKNKKSKNQLTLAREPTYFVGFFVVWVTLSLILLK